MKKIIALMLFLVMILLIFSSCTENSVSSTETSSADTSSVDTSSAETSSTETSSNNTSSYVEYLSDDWFVEKAKTCVDIPEGVNVTYKVSEAYWYDFGGCNYKNVDFYENGVLVAHASVLIDGEVLLLYPYRSPGSQYEGKNFFDYFEDVEFAWHIAWEFDKYPDETVTEEELASYSGKIFVPIYIGDISGIGYLKSITELDASKCGIKEIPSDISQCKNLKRLELTKSYFLENISESICELENLEFLRISLSGADKLPENIGNLKKLKYLYAVACGITTIPESIGGCESLVVLDLHSNDITEIPDSITNLKNLKSLDLGYTKITSLPENIGQLTEMIRLDVFGLDIRQLPQSMKNMTKLEFLNVYNNYNLNEDYKQWFPNECYKCTTDPEYNPDWDDGYN